MKIWEAMLEGFKRVGRQHFGGRVNDEGNAVCAAAAASLVITGHVNDPFREVDYPIGPDICHVCELSLDEIYHTYKNSGYLYIAHLNDTHKLTIPEIAMWVKEQEEKADAEKQIAQEVTVIP